MIIISNSSVVIDRVKDTIDPDFDSLLWVLKAAGKDPARPNLTGIFIDDHKAVCTDGHRLHVAELDTAPESGLYLIRQATKKQILLEKAEMEFPQYEKIFPTAEAEITLVNFYDNNSFSFFVEDVLKTGVSVNVDFLRDIYLHGGDFVVEAYPSKKVIVFKETSRRAFVATMVRHGVMPKFREAQKAA